MRRPPGRGAAAAHDLLGWLHRIVPGCAPRPVSLDGDEWVVEHVPGEVSGVPFAPFLLQPGALASVGRLLQRLHEATAGYQPPAGATWAAGAVPKRPGDVVCHGDVGAGNLVWRAGVDGPIDTRLDELCGGYGRYPAAEVLAAYRQAIDDEIARRRRLGGRGVEPWARFLRVGQVERMEETAAWFDASGYAG